MTTLEIYENHIKHILHHSPFLFHLEYAILSLLYYFLSHPCFWRDVQDGTFADSVLKYLRMMRRWFMTNSCARIGDWTFGWMCFFFHPAMWQFYRYYWNCLLDSFHMMYSNELKVNSSFNSQQSWKPKRIALDPLKRLDPWHYQEATNQPHQATPSS